MRKQFLMLVVVGVLALTVASSLSLGGIDYTYNGGATWADTGTGWSPNGAYPTAADTALFNKHIRPTYGTNWPGATAVALSSDTAVASLTFTDNTPYTFNSGTLTLGSGGLTDQDVSTVTVNSILAGTGGVNLYPGSYVAEWQNGFGSITIPKLVLTSTANSFTGTINIYGGLLVIGGATSNPTNDPTIAGASGISIGSQGAYGTFSVNAHPTTITKNITLNGNGAIFRSTWGWTTYTGSISGAGQLILDQDRVYLQGTGSYQGGTRVWSGWNDAGLTSGDAATGAGSTTANVLGSGDVYVEYGGALAVGYATNMSATAQVHVTNAFISSATTSLAGNKLSPFTGSIFGARTDFVPAFSGDSNGTFAIDCTSGTNINTRLAAGSAQLGNGYMSYGARFGGTFTGTSLMADVDNVYRFIGQNWLTLNNSVVNDNTTGTDYGVTVSGTGGDFGLCVNGVNNTFSGPLTINFGAYYQQRYGTTNAAYTPMGAATGNIVMNGAANNRTVANLQVYSTVAGQLASVKNDLSFIGQDRVYLNSNGAGPASLDLTTLTRVSRGTMYIDGQQGNLGKTTGNYEQLVVSSPGADLTSSNGMVSPAYTTSLNNGNFLNYGAAGTVGFSQAVYSLNGVANANVTSTADLATAAAADIINVTGAAGTGSGITVNAVKTAANITGSGALNITSGGLITNGAVTISAPLNFASAEGVLYANNSVTLSGQITGSNGLTISATGNKAITLTGNNSTTLSGTITVNQGILTVGDGTGHDWLYTLGSGATSGSDIVLNGGEINFSWEYSIPLTKSIYLGAAGGWFTGSGMNPSGLISGPGMLYWSNATNSGITTPTAGSGNTYTGGTYITGRCGISGPQVLGTGPVDIDMNGLLTVSSTNSLISTQRITFVGTTQGPWSIQNYQRTGQMYVQADNVSVGSIAGNGGNIFIGVVHNGNGVQTFTFTTGSDNTSTEYMGSIMDYSTAAGILPPSNTMPMPTLSRPAPGPGPWAATAPIAVLPPSITAA